MYERSERTAAHWKKKYWASKPSEEGPGCSSMGWEGRLGLGVYLVIVARPQINHDVLQMISESSLQVMSHILLHWHIVIAATLFHGRDAAA